MTVVNFPSVLALSTSWFDFHYFQNFCRDLSLVSEEHQSISFHLKGRPFTSVHLFLSLLIYRFKFSTRTESELLLIGRHVVADPSSPDENIQKDSVFIFLSKAINWICLFNLRIMKSQEYDLEVNICRLCAKLNFSNNQWHTHFSAMN